MTEKQLRDKVVAYAEDWQGLRDGDESHMVIIDVYNSIEPLPRGYRMKPDDPWCAAYVSAVAQVCELTSIIFPECGCKQMMQLYQDAGRWMEDDDYIPSPGDVIFYDWEDDGKGDNVGTPDHVGIVTSVSGGVINCIEGNYSHMVCQTSHLIDGQNIRGYGLPDYASVADGEPEPDPYEGTVTVELPTLMIGAEGGYVRTAQTLLIARGYDCGNRPWAGVEKADGEFGRMTEKSVAFFQSKRSLPITGVIDHDTWDALERWEE